jgi:hypothetical protein
MSDLPGDRCEPTVRDEYAVALCRPDALSFRGSSDTRM